MQTATCNKQMVIELMNKGYHIIIKGVPKRLEVDFWDYLESLDDYTQLHVLEDLLQWRERDLTLIDIAA